MKKRLLSLVLSFVMLLTMLPVTVWAEDVSADEPAPDVQAEDVSADELTPIVLAEPAETVTETVSAPNSSPDNDELFMGYLYQLAGINPEKEPVTSSDPFSIRHEAMGTVAITGINQTVYDSLAAQVKLVAENGGSTVLFCPLTDLETYSYSKYAAWTTEEHIIIDDVTLKTYYETEYRDKGLPEQKFVEDMALSTGYLIDYGDAVDTTDDALKNDFSFQTVMNMLLANMPYDLYWYDKTEGASFRPKFNIVTDTEKDTVTIEYGIEVYFNVANSYWRGQSVVLTDNEGKEYTIRVNVISNVTAASAAAQNARNVVATHSDKQDYEKLQSYLTYVNGQVSYNSAALNTGTSYGDPWQLIYVFDDDPDTNVVCEGYAKAFKFLCDLSKWNDPDFDCYLATGQMIGGTGEGPHMWNIVHIRDANNPNGASFLVDPTNCDEGMVGGDYGLFLRGNSNPYNVERYNKKTGKYYNSLTYTFTFGSQSINFGYDEETQALYGIDELTLAAQDYEKPVIDQSTGLRYREVTDSEWVDDGESGYYLAQVDAEIRSDLALYADREIDVQIGFLNSDGTFTVLSADDLTVSGNIELNAQDMRDEEDRPCLWLVPIAPYADGAITYHNEADGKDYTMNVPVRLPDVGFYSEAKRDKGHYIEKLVFNNDPEQDVAYLFGPTDATLISVEKSKWCTAEYEIQNETTMAEDGFAKIVLKSYGGGYVDFDVKYQQAGKEPASGYGFLSLKMGVPALGYVSGYWDGQAFQTGDDAKYSLTISLDSFREIQVVYFDGETTTPVSAEELQFEGIEVEIEQNDDTYLLVTPKGVSDGSISYQKDGKPYTLPVTVTLPDVGFYRSDTATKENYLSNYKYTGNEDVVYLFCPDDATLISVEKQEWCTVDYEIQNKTTMAEDGYAKILLKSFGDGYVAFNVKYQQGDEEPSDDSASLSLQMGAIGLGYRYLGVNWDSNTYYTRENVYNDLLLTASSDSYIQVVFYDGEDYIPVSLEDLQLNGIEARIVQNNDTYLYVKPEGANDGSISYQVDDITYYTLPVTVQLPDVGYYSSSSATKETFLSSFGYKGDNNMVYLVWPEDVTRISVEKTEWCTAEYEIQNEATMAENHYAAISLHISGDSRLSLHVSLSYPNMEGATDDSFNLTIRDMRPGLRLVSTWDNVTNQPAANATVWARFTMQPQGARRIQLAFFDGERYQLLTPEDVTTTNVTLFPREDGYLMLEASGIDDGTISYPKDNNIYTMEIPVQLPDVWYYSSPVASKDTYLNNWVYDGTDKTDTIYLVATNGFKITEPPTLLGGRTAECTLSEDGTYATIRLTDGQNEFVDSLRLSASLRNGKVPATRNVYFTIYYSNLTANIELPQDIQGTGRLTNAKLWDKDGKLVDGNGWNINRNQIVFRYKAQGEYLLEITWSGCVTRTVPVTVEEGTASVTVPLCAIGNINGAASALGQAVDASDMQCLFEYLSQGQINSSLVKDKNDSAQVEYFLQVADVNEDGAVNILDYQALYEMVKA